MNLSINKRYSFNTLAPTVLGATYENVKVIGILSLESALKVQDVVTQYETLKDFISNLPDDPNVCTFIVFEKVTTTDAEENIDRETIILAYEYIDINTIKEVNRVNLRVDIFDATTEDMAIVSTRLKELGYANFKVTIVYEDI